MNLESHVYYKLKKRERKKERKKKEEEKGAPGGRPAGGVGGPIFFFFNLLFLYTVALLSINKIGVEILLHFFNSYAMFMLIYFFKILF